jgi:hypothetical protein
VNKTIGRNRSYSGASVMLKNLLPQLCQELALAAPSLDEHKVHHLKIGPFEIALKDLEPGYYFYSNIGPLPTKKKEDFLMMVMKANFLGQGTGGGALGLKEDESSLTLSLSLPYEMNYKAFKDNLEEFANFVDYWKKETVRHETEAKN